MADQDKILQFLSINGPSLPTKVAKLIGTQILIASAHLSDLSAQGKVRISDLKVGGSPLYFLPGQEEHLERFAQSNMNPKDYQVLLNLKEKRVLREKELDLLSKVALRGLKDFAFPLQVTYHGQAELFWKWQLMSEEEASHAIRDILLRAERKEEELRPVVSESVASSLPIPPKPVAASIPLSSKPAISEEEKAKKIEEIWQKTVAQPQPAQPLPTPSFPTAKSEGTTKEQFHKDEQQKKLEAEERPVEKKVRRERIERPIVVEKTEKPKVEKPVEKFDRVEKQEKIVKPVEKLEKLEKIEKPERITKVEKPKKKNSVDFFTQLEDYFQEKGIILEQKEILRKNAEFNFLLKVPSVVGTLKYFCKAKNKAKCDEKDLSSAYMEAQIKKLPLLLLYSGEFTSKAKEMLDTGAFENAIVKRIE